MGEKLTLEGMGSNHLTLKVGSSISQKLRGLQKLHTSARMANYAAGLAELTVQSEELYISHLLTGNGDDIQEAVRCAQKVLDLMPPTDPSTPIMQYDLARSLFRKFLETRQVEDIELAIKLFADVSQTTSERLTDDMRQKCLHYLTLSCFLRDGTLDELLKLNDPDVYGPPGPPLQIKTLTRKFDEDEVFHYLERTLLRYGLRPPKSLEDLDSAIQLARQAVEFFSADKALIVGPLHLVLKALNQAFNQALKIESCEQALRFLAPDPIKTSILLFHLGNLLLVRASLQSPLQRKLEDIDEAAHMLRSALSLRLPDQLVGPCLVYASSAFVERFEQLKKPEDLDNAFVYAMRAMNIFNSVEHAEPCMNLNSRGVAFLWCLDNLARVMRTRYVATEEANDLNIAIDASSRAIDIAETNDPRRDLPRLLSSFATNLKLRGEKTGHAEDMKLADKALERAADILSVGDPRQRGQALQILHPSSRMANNSAGLAELTVQSQGLYISYLLTGNRDDIEETVRCARKAFDLMPPTDPSMPLIQYNLARSLFRKFLETRQIEDIKMAIEIFQSASELLTDDVRQKCVHYLTISCLLRDGNLDEFLNLSAPDVNTESGPSFQMKTLAHKLDEDEVFRYLDRTLLKPELRSPISSEDLDSAIQLSRQALNFFSPDEALIFCSDRDQIRNALNQALNQALKFSSPDQALRFFSPDPVRISLFLFHLGNLLLQRLELQPKLEDNNVAVDCFCRALTMGLPLPLVGPCLLGASNAFVLRYEALRRQEDLDNAYDYSIKATKEFNAVEKVAPGVDMNKSILLLLDNTARVMRDRYLATGEVNDLNAAIDTLSRGIDIAETNDSHKQLPRLLDNFAAVLKLRVQRTGHAEDMRLAIKALQRAVDVWPPKDKRRVQSLLNLSAFEEVQGEKLLDEEYRKRALQHLEEAWYIGEEDLKPGMDTSVNAHSVLLDGTVSFVSRNFSNMEWPEETEAFARQYVSSDFTHHPLAGPSFAIVSFCVLDRWRRTHEMKYIDEAISLARCEIKHVWPAANRSIRVWLSLGLRLYDRYKSTEDKTRNEAVADRDEAVEVLLKGLRMSAGAPSNRILAGQAAIKILSELADWDRARELSREIVDLLVTLNGRSLEWQDKQFWLRQFPNLAATYASIALQAGSDVLDVIDTLETCRGSILGHVIDNQTDLVDLTNAAPEKAKRFRTLQDEINAVIDPSGNMETRVEQITRKDKAEGEIHLCLEDIRKLKGFDRFLRGPSGRELKDAAARGPIVIVNISLIRSDAIIITENASVLLPLLELKGQEAVEYCGANLTNFSFADLPEKNKKYRRLQRWLWDKCVKVIFEKLDDLVSAPAKFHIWWIGVGIASSLPFHAAGIYSAKDISQTALSRAISSYTPTLKILIHGRRKLKNDRPKLDVQGSTSKPKMAIIIMPSTPGLSKLEGVVDEAEAVYDTVSDTYSPEIISQPSAKDTMARMKECEVMHFACHGESVSSDPSSSHLLLQATIPDSIDELKVRDVAAAAVSGKLAFLSACSTAQNKLIELWDEVLHLAAGFQVAGYLHAIGNMWPAEDEISVHLVKGFYQHLVDAGELGDGDNVAKALNEALITVAKKHARQPLSWAQYVHFGV